MTEPQINTRKPQTMEASLMSCIIPVYNGERYLRESLDSILAQTYRPLEIIVAGAMRDNFFPGRSPLGASVPFWSAARFLSASAISTTALGDWKT